MSEQQLEFNFMKNELTDEDEHNVQDLIALSEALEGKVEELAERLADKDMLPANKIAFVSWYLYMVVPMLKQMVEQVDLVMDMLDAKGGVTDTEKKD